MKAITTTYHGPTDTRGSRIIASDGDGNRASVPYDHSLDAEGNYDAAALALCAKIGWGGRLVSGYLGNGKAAYCFDPMVRQNSQRAGEGVAVLTRESSSSFAVSYR